ncbi:MAG: hypothetical protein QM589_03255 [Thermomicrobiales bacterium]
MTEPLPPSPSADTIQAMLAMLGIEVATDDPRLPTLVREMEGQLHFAHLIDEVLADIPAEAVAGALGTFDPAWPADGGEGAAS